MNAALDLTSLSNVQPIVTCTIEGIMEESDLQLLVAARQASAPNTQVELKRVKERHHSVARLIASGMTQTLVAEIVNLSESYLSTLLNSPAMVELVAFYRSQHTAAHEVVEERLRTLALSAAEQLQERVDAGAADDNTLIQAAKLGFDRSGHGPRSTVNQVNETHLFDHAELRRLDREARAESDEHIIKLPAPSKELGDEDS